MKILIYWVLVIVALPAWGIGRSGNGTVSSSVSGFTAEVPPKFGVSEVLPQARLRVLANFVEFRSYVPLRPFLEFSEVSDTFGNLSGLNRLETAKEMANMGWEMKTSPDACIDTYQRSSASGNALAVFWGPAKGVVVIGPQSRYLQVAEKEFLSSLKLVAGACAW